VLLSLLAAGLVVLNHGHGRGDWQFFSHASEQLLRPNWPLLYERHPDVVTGPLALVAVKSFNIVGGYEAMVAISAAVGVMLVSVLERANPGRQLVTLVGGSAFLVGWLDMAAFGHVDDALVYIAVVVATSAIVNDRTDLASIAFGLALGAKQWAFALIPELLGASRRWRGLAVAISIGVLVWLPFTADGVGAIRGGTDLAYTSPDSLPARLGILRASMLAPEWYRVVELGAVLVLACVVGWRCWAAVPIVALGMRCALDPSTWSYYAAGVLLGALILDFIVSRSFVPWWTLSAFVATRIGPDVLIVLVFLAIVWSLKVGERAREHPGDAPANGNPRVLGLSRAAANGVRRP
jgi:hypothetical protein